MVRTATIVVVIMLASGTASAQSTTSCSTNFGVTTCRTTPDPQVNWGILQQAPDPGRSVMQGFENGLRMRREIDRARQEQEWRRMLEESQRSRELVNTPPPAPPAEDRALRLEVSGLLMKGDCQGAQDKALAAGNINLAAEAKTYCMPLPAK